MTHYNIIGFKNRTVNYEQYLHCVVHIGTPLITDPKDPDALICPECGLPYQESELKHETGPVSKFGSQGTTKAAIFQGKPRKKKLVAQDGGEIPEDDEVARMDIATGNTILRYHEDKIEV